MTPGEPTWVIVPVKSLDQVKQRLQAVLPPPARRVLMLVMLQDVLATLRRVEGLGPVLVVTPDAGVAEIAERGGAQVVREAASNGHSAAAVAGFMHARSHGAARALTIPADAPLVTAGELRELLERDAMMAGPHVTLVPNGEDEGTNGFLVSPPDLMQPSFGPGSFARHLAHAAAQRIACCVHRLPGLALDIDEPRDLAHLLQRKRTDPRYHFLREHTLDTALEAERQ